MSKTCGECKHYIAMNRCVLHNQFVKDDDFCGCYIPKTQPITNGDKIRKMSNEELATFLQSRTSVYPYFCTQNIAANKCNSCLECWLEYLNAPAESEVEYE